MLEIESEDFEYYDVSGIKIEGKLALGKNRGKECVIRSEDEAFIKEAIWERSGAVIGKQKITNWMDDLWWKVMYNIDGMQKGGAWVRKEFLEGKQDLPEVILPNEDGYFTDGYMMEMAKYIVYLGKDEWPEIDSSSCFRDKSHSEIYDVYRSIAKMRGLIVGPKGNFSGVSVEIKYKYYLKEEVEESKEKIKEMTAHGNVNGAEAYDYTADGTFYIDPSAEYEVKTQSGDVLKREQTLYTLYKRQMHTVKLKDGKDSEGNQQYREEKAEEEYMESISVEAAGFGKFKDGACEREWKLVGAFGKLRVALEHTEGSSHCEYIVAYDCSSSAMKINQDAVKRVIEKNPVPKGDFVSVTVTIASGIALVGDIKWKMAIKKENE